MSPRLRAIWDLLRTNVRLTRALLRTRGCVVVLGDSHATLFNGLRGFLPLHVGAVTLHRLGRPDQLIDQVRSRQRPVLLLPGLRIGRRDTVLVSAGEIDVRCHVHQQVATGGRDEQEVIGDLVDRLVARLAELRARIGCRVGAVAVPPPVRAIQNDLPSNPYPIRGTLEDRVRWTAMLNQGLQDQLARAGHVFLPMPPDLTNSDGSLREDRSDGTVHLNPSLAKVIATGLPSNDTR